MLRTPILIALCIIAALAGSGCQWLHGGGHHAQQGPLHDNPLFIPVPDREFLWNQLVDTTDDYFRIEREERIQLLGDVMTPGRIDTFPKIGSTVFEPWRGDSTAGYERRHATLQTVRRYATVSVQPAEGGYWVQVAVMKELEDVDRPEHSTAGGSTFRHDGSVVGYRDSVGGDPVTLGWIPLGRDVSLEQKMLAEIKGRMNLEGTKKHDRHGWGSWLPWSSRMPENDFDAPVAPYDYSQDAGGERFYPTPAEADRPAIELIPPGPPLP